MDVHLDLLGIPNLRSTKRIDRDGKVVVEAETIKQTYYCCVIQRLGKWGSASQRRQISDTPHGGIPVTIHLKVHRAQCYECGKKGIRENFDFIQPGKHMTRRMYNHIAKHTVLVGNTNSATGRLLNVSEATARRITHSYIDRHIEKLERPTPRVLGIDEKRIARVFRAVLGNVEERTVLNMLPDRAESLEQFLRDIPNPENIEVVCIDQFDGYRTTPSIALIEPPSQHPPLMSRWRGDTRIITANTATLTIGAMLWVPVLSVNPSTLDRR